MSEPPREGKAPLPAFPTQVKLCVKILALLNSSGRWLSPAVLHVPRAPPFAWWGWEAAYSPLLLAVGIWAGLLQGGPGADRSPPHSGGSSQASCPISTRQGEHHRHKTWLHVRSLLSLPMLTHCWALSPAPAFPTPSSTKFLGLHCHCWLLCCPWGLCDPKLLQTRHESVTNSQGLSEELYLTSAFQNRR